MFNDILGNKEEKQKEKAKQTTNKLLSKDLKAKIKVLLDPIKVDYGFVYDACENWDEDEFIKYGKASYNRKELLKKATKRIIELAEEIENDL